MRIKTVFERPRPSKHVSSQRLFLNSPSFSTIMDGRPTSVDLRMTSVRKGQYDVEIVQAVQSRKVLYDKSHEHHKNPRVKEMEWSTIAAELQVPPVCIIKRWTVIRERFASEKRKVQQLGPSSWWLMNHMEWLDVHIQPRQRGKYTEGSPNLANLPNLTHISNLAHLSNLASITKYGDSKIKMEDEDDDSRSQSPIIAYPEVLMKDVSSDEDAGSYNSLDGTTATNHSSIDGERRGRRGTNGSEDSSQGPLALGLDLDEAAAARMLAAIKSIEDPLLRHRFRQRVHLLSEECELASFQK